MRRVSGFLSLFALLSLAHVHAAVVVNTTLNLTHFTITPAAGTIQIILPTTAIAFAEALDSQGGFDQNFDSQDNTTATASALTLLAAAFGTADAPGFTGSAASSIHIPNIDASASSTGRSSLQGFLQLTGVSSPVNVTFAAALTAGQTLQTDPYGLSASSEIVFSFLMPDLSSDNILFLDSLKTIGPSQFSDSPFNNTLTNSATLNPDTPYFFVIGLDSESSGLNAVPEPSCFLLAGMGASMLLLRRLASK